MYDDCPARRWSMLIEVEHNRGPDAKRQPRDKVASHNRQHHLGDLELGL